MKRLKSPSRRDSYSDSSRSGDEEVIGLPAQVGLDWSSALYQTSDEAMTQAHSQYETHSGQEEAVRTILYSDQEAPSKSELEDRYAVYDDSRNIAERVHKGSLLHLFIDTLLLFCFLDLHKVNIGPYVNFWVTATLYKLILVFCLFICSDLSLDLPLIPTCRTVPDVTTSVLINDCYATPASELTPHLGGMDSLLSQLEKNAEEYEPVIYCFCFSVA